MLRNFVAVEDLAEAATKVRIRVKITTFPSTCFAA